MKKLIPTMILVLAVVSFGQNKPEAFLLDEFNRASCEEVLARMDSLYVQVQNSGRGAKGFFVISGGKEYIAQKLEIELRLEMAKRVRGAADSPISIVRAEESGPTAVKMWFVPPGATTPDIKETKWDLRLSPDIKPFSFSSSDDICSPAPTKQVNRVAKELLDANPNGSVYVIVRGNTVRERRSELIRVKKEFKSFDSNRIRYLLRKASSGYSNYYFALGKPNRTEFAVN